MATPLRNSTLWTTLGAMTLMAACSASAPGGDALGTNQEALATPFPNDKAAYDYFRGKGLTNFQAAAVVGNLDQESGVNPTISQEGGGVGRGIAQWSTGGRWDSDKNDNVLAFAAMEGKSAMSLDLQLDFIWYELTTFSDFGLVKLQASTNVTDATQAFEDNYEGCVYAQYPECALPQRVTYAKDVLAAYGDDPVMGGGGAGGTGSAGMGGAGVALGGSSGTAGATAGAGGSGTVTGGGAGAAGSLSIGGGSNVAGSASVGGGSNVAGGSSAGSSSVAGQSAVASTSTDSSCALSPSGSQRSARDRSVGFSGVLLALGLALRGRRRRTFARSQARRGE